MLQISLCTRYRSLVFGISAGLLVFGYSYLAVRMYRASRYATDSSEAGMVRAIALDFGNAENHSRLGRYYFYAVQDPVRAAEEYRLSTHLNSYDADHWLDLVSAYEVLDQRAEQDEAIAAAYRNGPYTPDVLWSICNLYLVRGDLSDALPLLRRVLEIWAGADWGRMNSALNTGWRATHNVSLLLQSALPARPDVHAAFLLMLVTNGAPDSADAVWRRIVQLGQPVDPHLTFSYFDTLLQQGRAADAKHAWSALRKLNRNPEENLADEELMVNGGFEEPVVNGGLDWRIHPPPGVSVSADSTQFHGGALSLRITCDGEPFADAGVYQYVPVEPGKKYRFDGYIRTEDVLTRSGLRFFVKDTQDGTRYVLSDDVTGTTYWRVGTGSFTTGPSTHLLMVRLIREPATGRIKGTFWVDDISLREEP
jgi:hypothetical protein